MEQDQVQDGRLEGALCQYHTIIACKHLFELLKEHCKTLCAVPASGYFKQETLIERSQFVVGLAIEIGITFRGFPRRYRYKHNTNWPTLRKLLHRRSGINVTPRRFQKLEGELDALNRIFRQTKFNVKQIDKQLSPLSVTVLQHPPSYGAKSVRRNQWPKLVEEAAWQIKISVLCQPF